MKVMSRCTGHCCERFNLPFTASEMQRMGEAMERDEKFFALDSGDIKNHSFAKEEVLKITGMIIPLGDSYLDHNNESMIPIGRHHDGFRIKQIGEIVVNETSWYTCKNFNKETRNCDDYENRPQMCKNHPDFGSCSYKACTLACKSIKEMAEEALNAIGK